MATKTFEELKQLAIQIRDEKTNKQNTATRVGTAMLEHINKLEQDYYDKTQTDEELKERDDKLTELSDNVGLYNVDKNVPLGSGFYTSTTARAAVPTSVRKLGLIITYKTDSTISITEQFIGSSVSAWATDSNWVKILNQEDIIKLGYYNLDISKPLQSGYYNAETAHNAVPVYLRKPFMILVYKISENIVVVEQFNSNNLGYWTNLSYWKQINISLEKLFANLNSADDFAIDSTEFLDVSNYNFFLTTNLQNLICYTQNKSKIEKAIITLGTYNNKNICYIPDYVHFLKLQQSTAHVTLIGFDKLLFLFKDYKRYYINNGQKVSVKVGDFFILDGSSAGKVLYSIEDDNGSVIRSSNNTQSKQNTLLITPADIEAGATNVIFKTDYLPLLANSNTKLLTKEEQSLSQGSGALLPDSAINNILYSRLTGLSIGYISTVGYLKEYPSGIPSCTINITGTTAGNVDVIVDSEQTYGVYKTIPGTTISIIKIKCNSLGSATSGVKFSTYGSRVLTYYSNDITAVQDECYLILKGGDLGFSIKPINSEETVTNFNFSAVGYATFITSNEDIISNLQFIYKYLYNSIQSSCCFSRPYSDVSSIAFNALALRPRNNYLNNKTYVSLGTSITSNSASYAWQNLVAKEFNMNITNLAISGFNPQNALTDEILNKMPSDTMLVSIMFGINGWITSENIDNDNIDNSIGNFNRTINFVRERFPMAIIAIGCEIDNTQRPTSWNDIKNIADNKKVIWVDTSYVDYPGGDRRNGIGYWSTDGSHLNEYGNSRMAACWISTLKKCIYV